MVWTAAGSMGYKALQTSTHYIFPAGRAIDGSTNQNMGVSPHCTGTTATVTGATQYWAMDLGMTQPVAGVDIYGRTDVVPGGLASFHFRAPLFHGAAGLARLGQLQK
jgi:hypothetical protein